MEQEDFMLIRIRRHDNKCKETQVAVYELIIKIVFTIIKGVLYGQETGNPHTMRINLIIVMNDMV